MKKYIISDTLADSVDMQSSFNERNDGKMDIASLISKNGEVEYESIEGYQALLAIVEDDLDAKAVINEIISDEKNHIERLNELLLKYDKIQPSKD